MGRDAECFVKPSVQVALVIKPGQERRVRYGCSVREQLLRCTYTVLNDVLVRRQARFLLETANEPESAQLRVREQTIRRGTRLAGRYEAGYGLHATGQSPRILGKKKTLPGNIAYVSQAECCQRGRRQRRYPLLVQTEGHDVKAVRVARAVRFMRGKHIDRTGRPELRPVSAQQAHRPLPDQGHREHGNVGVHGVTQGLPGGKDELKPGIPRYVKQQIVLAHSRSISEYARRVKRKSFFSFRLFYGSMTGNGGTMCGRFQVDLDDDDGELGALFQHGPDGPALSESVQRGEVFPTQNAGVLVFSHTSVMAVPMAWGFPRYDGKGVIINARVETALQKPLFRKALLSCPVVIPTSGFYEWKSIPGRKHKEKYLFREPGRSVLYLAGFFTLFPETDIPQPRRFVILTTEANASMRPYHNRMPVLLRKEELPDWLRGGNRGTLLTREPFALEAIPHPA